MWFVWEPCGIICSFFTYVIVFTVQYGFLRVGIWEDLLQGNDWAWIHLTVFSFNVFMIIASHLKCMTTEPGLLPLEYDELDPNKLPDELNSALNYIKQQLQKDDDDDSSK